MADNVHFGIIEQFDMNKHYDELDDGFAETLSKFRCIDIPDDIVNEWVCDMAHIDTHWHWYGRQAKGLAQCGVTLIPPGSLNEIMSIVQHYELTSSYSEENTLKINRFIHLLNQAKTQNNWVIHFGL